MRSGARFGTTRDRAASLLIPDCAGRQLSLGVFGYDCNELARQKVSAAMPIPRGMIPAPSLSSTCANLAGAESSTFLDDFRRLPIWQRSFGKGQKKRGCQKSKTPYLSRLSTLATLRKGHKSS